MSSKSPLIMIVGRTASGKDTLAKEFISMGYDMILSYTTRSRRPGECDTHIFIDSIDGYSNRWVESEVAGNDYFVHQQDVEDKDILLVDPQGFYSLMEQEEFDRDYVIYYLVTTKDIRKQRYMKRGGATEEEFRVRNNAEDHQFTEFEKRLTDVYFRSKHNVSIIRSETADNRPVFRDL